MTMRITPFLMFEGTAQAAMDLYLSLFPDARIESIARYGDEGPGAPGTVMHAVVSLAGQRVMCSDSFVKHAFTFTPSTSMFVECGTAAEVDALFAGLSEGGQVLMPLDAYPFSPRFAWVNDRFGVSWQLSAALDVPA
jgi:predicted 3-demethylubiquinone-9 3-methyltransferase (glyoxalase superfamily)